jgi:hypothetical protein
MTSFILTAFSVLILSIFASAPANNELSKQVQYTCSNKKEGKALIVNTIHGNVLSASYFSYNSLSFQANDSAELYAVLIEESDETLTINGKGQLSSADSITVFSLTTKPTEEFHVSTGLRIYRGHLNLIDNSTGAAESFPMGCAAVPFEQLPYLSDIIELL